MNDIGSGRRRRHEGVTAAISLAAAVAAR